ncbi:PREDICTED: uncharacterized protein LOC109177184 isoform X1 [Ipomoea nil]|uniref:uncharacterized protein LOC109177184 isoform X1 n=1 Tax=Ipomoea nil TaxID=35883 RepID=UPI00090153C4|nr:PREDICTED: uncharacterized protein LOC109177184 isoform X1 [Ipomoea nil]
MNESCCYLHPKEVVVGVCALCLNERLTVLASKQEKAAPAAKFYHTITNNNNNKKNPHRKTSSSATYYGFSTTTKPHQPSRIHLPKIFTLSSLLRRRRSDPDCHHDGGASTSSREGAKTNRCIDKKMGKGALKKDGKRCMHKNFFVDSFISIKFENNGAASWEKEGTVPMVSLNHCDMPWRRSSNATAMVEHAKPRGSLRWRKRIGHIFHVIKLRRSSTKSNAVCHVAAKLEGGVKVVRRSSGQGWMRTLTKRKTKE